MDGPSSKNNRFARVLIVSLCVSLLALGAHHYLHKEFEISAGLLVLITFILVLVLSETFDNFSVGKLVTMSRAMKEKEAQTTELKKENAELREQLFSVSTTVSQQQSLKHTVNVYSAPDDEIADKKKEEKASALPQQQVAVEREFDNEKVEEWAISKFVASNNLQAFNLVRHAKLSTQFSGLDPITDVAPIFDAYINAIDSEIFIEIRPVQSASIMFRDRLYVTLAKIHHYKMIKKANVYLALLLVSTPEQTTIRPAKFYVDRLQREFEPAMTSGLLRIRIVEPTNEEIKGFYHAP